jgi:hypothetical protein
MGAPVTVLFNFVMETVVLVLVSLTSVFETSGSCPLKEEFKNHKVWFKEWV